MVQPRFRARAMASSLMLASTALAACSVGPRGSDPTSGPFASHGRTAEPPGQGSSAVRSSADQATPPSGQSESDVVSLSVQPSSVCTVNPEHADQDPTHKDLVPVGADGQLRFYVPSEDWGSRLQVDCSAGDARTRHVVDLNDESTFARKPVAELAARSVGTLPALDGDPAALPLYELLRRGYPPRPDPARSAERYAVWLHHVTTPTDLLAAMPVARLGAHGGTYSGDTSGPWDGFVQAGGFSPAPDYWSQGNVYYTVYAANMTVPSTAWCGTRYPCDSIIWAGIGGYPTMFYGTSIVGELIQSGMHLNGFQQIWYLFYEYTPGGVTDVPLPPNKTLSKGDQVQVWGWSAADSGCQTPSNSGQYGCFSFQNFTKGWTVSPLSLPLTGAYFLPTTAEYIAEMSSGTSFNADYGTAEISAGAAFDPSNNDRGDPATGPDPFVWITTGSDGNLNSARSTPSFSNGSRNSPADPMYFFWNHF